MQETSLGSSASYPSSPRPLWTTASLPLGTGSAQADARGAPVTANINRRCSASAPQPSAQFVSRPAGCS